MCLRKFTSATNLHDSAEIISSYILSQFGLLFDFINCIKTVFFKKLNEIISLFRTLLLTEGSRTAKFTFHLFLCNNPLGLLRNTMFLMQCQHLLPFTLSLQKTQRESQMLQHAGVLDPLEC